MPFLITPKPHILYGHKSKRKRKSVHYTPIVHGDTDITLNGGFSPRLKYELPKLASTPKGSENIADILIDIFKHFAWSNTQVFANTRKWHVVIKRQICYYILYTIGYTYHQIGLFFERDHSTILAARTKIMDYLDFDKEFIRKYKHLIISFLEQKKSN